MNSLLPRAHPVLVMLLAVLGACANKNDEEETAAPAARLQTQVLVLEKTPLERLVDGTIEAINQATVSAQTSGRITDIYYDVNDFVPAGAVIMRLRATEQRAGLQQAQATLQQAQTRAQEAEQQFVRVEKLHQERVATKSDYDTALANRDAAQAQLAAARAALGAAQEGMAYTEVRAPYAGIVTARLAQVGESVRPGTPLMSGVSLQYLRVNLDLPQNVVEKVRAIRKAAIYVNDKRVEATRFTVFPEADANTHTFRARANLPENATDLNPGMFVKVGLVVGEVERLLIPVSALVTRSEVTAVYVRNKSNELSLRQLRLGQLFNDRVEVLAGLSAGEAVVLDPVAAAQTIAAGASAAHE